MILDTVTLEIQAGSGGNGSVSFRREKFIPRGGPDGGNGGKGGSIYFESVPEITALKQFRHKKSVIAKNGGHGKAKKMHGENADDIFIRIPVGSTVTRHNSGYVWTFDEVGIRKRIARGGYGGKGNFEFRSSTNQTPMEFEKGRAGEKFEVTIDMRFIADVGLIGLPSAGKSSLLNALTEAHAKVGAYPFTTLEPNLGVAGKIMIADIPGLIEGAHEGKGLGIRFLKHIEKTHVLLHCIDATQEDPLHAYKVIRDELGAYNPELLEKNEIIIFTKSDLSSEADIAKLKALFPDHKSIVVSIIDDEQMKNLYTLLQTL